MMIGLIGCCNLRLSCAVWVVTMTAVPYHGEPLNLLATFPYKQTRMCQPESSSAGRLSLWKLDRVRPQRANCFIGFLSLLIFKTSSLFLFEFGRLLSAQPLLSGHVEEVASTMCINKLAHVPKTRAELDVYLTKR